MKEKFFILELHDVAPCFLPEFEKMLLWAEVLEVSEPVVLVTPKWQRECKPEDKNKYIRIISELKAKLVLHGLTHSAPASLWDRLWYGEKTGAEFKNVSEEKALQWISSGKAALEDWTGQTVDWFCAPRWQMNERTIFALKKLRFRGYLAKNYIYSFKGSKINVPALSFDHGRRRIICAANRLLRQARVKKNLHSGTPFRLALHPRDMKTKAVLEELNTVKGMLISEGYKSRPLDPMAQGAFK